MLKENDRRQYSVTVDIDITYKIDHWRKIKNSLGMVDCIRTIRDVYPFLSLTDCKKVAESI